MKVYNFSTSDIEAEMIIDALKKNYEKLLHAANKAEPDSKEYINNAAGCYKKLHDKYKSTFDQQMVEAAEVGEKLHVA